MNEQKSDYKQTLQVDISLAIYGSSRPPFSLQLYEIGDPGTNV